MAYIVPNATETGSGKKYANINQAEPDSVDIEALGNRANWVRKGCTVSIDNEYVSVSSGTVVINNVPYACSGLASQKIDRAVVGARSDLLVARLSGAVVTVVLLEGVDTATNPIFPKSRSVLTNSNDFLALSNYDPATDVLIASIYVTASETDENNIVDKRIINTSPITRYSGSTAAPSVSATLDVIGDVVVSSNDIVYVRTNSSWDAIASRAYANVSGLPIGSVFAWAGPSATSPGESYLECNGDQVLISDYPLLQQVLGTTYGTAAAGYFKLPKINDDRTIIGSATSLGSSGGSNSTTLTSVHIPAHDHNVSVNKHTGTVLDHSVDMTAGSGTHKHSTPYHWHRGALAFRDYTHDNGYHVANVSHSGVSAYHVEALGIADGDLNWDVDGADKDIVETQGKMRFYQNSNPDTGTTYSGHTHPTSVDRHPDLIHNVNESTYGAPDATRTAVPTLPNYIKMRWYIRAK